MGKKTKIGKARRDKFYQLAKETGYRARSAFKLIQLNRKFEFLQKSRTCIDLCAAPGGWLQVAQKYMPVSSVIIGIDLVPIKAIGNVITLQEDITTEKCRLALKKTLPNWKADIVLNDGAPNVGKNWIHDAFSQNQLTLSALKLAVEFLSKGGHFITKVFRSKDYQSLLWLFQQFFKKVHATKPQASRHESAEIFVYCERFLAPDHIDEKFFDSKYVFQDVDSEPASKLNIMHPEKQHRRAEGYAEGQTMLFHQVPAIDFILGSNHIEILEKTSELVLNDVLAKHSLTTDEIKECCKDIKVLGRREIRLLLTWRKKLKEVLEKSSVKEDNIKKAEVGDESEEENEEEKLAKEIEKLQTEEALDSKRKKRKVLKERKKLRDKMNLKMMLPNDEPIVQLDENLFKLNKIKSDKQLSKINEGDLSFMDGEKDSDNEQGTPGQKKSLYSRNKGIIDSDGEFTDLSDDDDDDYHDGLENEKPSAKRSKKDTQNEDTDNDSDSNPGFSSSNSSGDEDGTASDVDDENPLLVDVEQEEKREKKNKNIELWFKKDIFEGMENEDDEDLDLEILMHKNQPSAAKVAAKPKKEKNHDNKAAEQESDSDSGHESDYDINSVLKNSAKSSVDGGQLEVVPQKEVKKPKKLTLDPEGLALGAMMIKSKKVKRDIIDSSFNKYTFNDDNLPAWFVENESKFNKKPLPVSKEMVQEYKEKLKEINARPIKKVAEAKARKKKRALRKMEKARKKAEAITETADMTDKEKVQQIRQVYKQAVKGKKKSDSEVAYVVAKKGMGKRVRRPAGVSGRFKVVDPRMKKDDRKRKATERSSKGKGKKRR